jgi:uncharacterized protein
MWHVVKAAFAIVLAVPTLSLAQMSPNGSDTNVKATTPAPVWNPSVEDFNAAAKQMKDDPGYRAILACGGDDAKAAARACAVRGYRFAIGGDAVPRDMAKALKYLRYACDAGDAMGCLNTGNINQGLAGPGVPIDLPAARTAFENGCTGGSGESCGRLSLMVLHGEGGPANHDQAVALRAKSCTLGFAKACAGTATAKAKTDAATGAKPSPVAPSPSFADQLNDAAEQVTPEFVAVDDCLSHKAAASCTAYAHMLAVGTPKLAKDIPKALRFLGLGCDGGDLAGCMALGTINLRNAQLGVTVDMPATRRVFEKSCASGIGEGCALLADMVTRGQGGPADAKAGQAYLTEACNRGFTAACAAAKR